MSRNVKRSHDICVTEEAVQHQVTKQRTLRRKMGMSSFDATRLSTRMSLKQILVDVVLGKVLPKDGFNLLVRIQSAFQKIKLGPL